jgi:hypothetical protein
MKKDYRIEIMKAIAPIRNMAKNNGALDDFWESYLEIGERIIAYAELLKEMENEPKSTESFVVHQPPIHRM